MRPRARIAVLLVLTFVVFAAMMSDASACPMCKAALASHDRSHGDWVGGFFWSILFMLSMPFVLLGSFSTYMYLLVRRARRETAQREGLQGEAAETKGVQQSLLEPAMASAQR
ncbi:MAG TPA: hypothetical protein VG826_17450 [Pirellulales bacterium]|nr:hypothetical protein [Pirellulales bacterium]